MKGWSGKSKILCIEQLGRAEKKTTKQKISQSSPSLCKYFPNIFLSPGYSKIFAAVFSKSLFNWSPHFITSFIKPVRIPTDSCENYCTAEMGFQLVPNILKKVKLTKCIHPNISIWNNLNNRKWGPRYSFLNFPIP